MRSCWLTTKQRCALGCGASRYRSATLKPKRTGPAIAQGKALASEDRRFALTLVDLGLPDGSGVELVHWLRACNEALPILVISAWSTEEMIVGALREWIGDMDCTSKAIQNTLTPLHSVFEDALNDELIDFNPLDRIVLTKLSGRRPRPVITWSALSLRQNEPS